jgi:hypothetical protein
MSRLGGSPRETKRNITHASKHIHVCTIHSGSSTAILCERRSNSVMCLCSPTTGGRFRPRCTRAASLCCNPAIDSAGVKLSNRQGARSLRQRVHHHTTVMTAYSTRVPVTQCDKGRPKVTVPITSQTRDKSKRRQWQADQPVGG